MKNIKTILLTAVSLFSAAAIVAQAKPASRIIENRTRNAVAIEINHPAAVATDALHQKLQRAGLSRKEVNGSASYMGVLIMEISKDKVNLYTKVEEGAANTSVIYMSASKEYGDLTNSKADSLITQHLVVFLNSLLKDINNPFADLDIRSQIVRQFAPDDDNQELLNEQADLQKEKVKIDVRLLAIQIELDAQKTDFDRKKPVIDDLRARRRAHNNQ